MNFIKHLEEKNIIIHEEIEILGVFVPFYLLACVLFYYNLSWFAWSFLIISIGAMCNLYVIDYNNLSMPTLPRKGEGLVELEQLNPGRRICVFGPETKLKWLADRFRIGIKYYSLGDLLLYAGAFFTGLLAIIILATKFKI
ncbi:MAG: hypothetical protein A2V69_03515 [Candidatus Portnoybacteria bacterium RBG_13_40_8]|uniref:Uncharacterized protein n=1 Tax=Candidatus Portnoybacteria bacterium RBG_13_40_8 TaxID=1801990 RepID=A0A1G2F2S8_9BACT|nr:MAG: hypothetical protein A2V69_03515 [Candidatus Portnoybacteria bacterium RBG_13_40_8]OGZ35031.1 MAG: hypothetical protein A2V60_01295 [Candidatus Portnoybacteria bacterium RIFCSPHIGHO2_01_FULL_39_19]